MDGNTVAVSREIPLRDLVKSEANVRRINASAGIKDLAEDILRRGMLQSLTVRPLANAEGVLDAEGAPEQKFTVTAGGRRLAALCLLVDEGRISDDMPIPCIVKSSGIEEEHSLAENVMREALHPLDQFRSFHRLQIEQNLGIEEIAARFFVAPQIVRQRLKLASVAPALLDLYASNEMTLEQLMAFTVNNDHTRQIEVWDALQRHYSREPHTIRRMLTEGALQESDRRVRFVGEKAYEAAGGMILRDLFAQGNGGWYRDAAIIERLGREKLDAIAGEYRGRGWKWAEVAFDFPYGHTNGLRRLVVIPTALNEDEQVRYQAVLDEYARLSDEYEGVEELPEEVDEQLGNLEREIALLDERPAQFEVRDMSFAGVFISLDHQGGLKIEEGYVRPEDVSLWLASREGLEPKQVDGRRPHGGGVDKDGSVAIDPETGEILEEPPAARLSDRLRAELTAIRTMALRDRLAQDPDAAFLVSTHAMVLRTFYGSVVHDTFMEIEIRSANLGVHAASLSELPSAGRHDRRQEGWRQQFPADPRDLWSVLVAFDRDSLSMLFAHCVAQSANALELAHCRRESALQNVDDVAAFLDLDIRREWKATAASYFSKVTKGQILDAVREAKGEVAAQMIDHLKKHDMAQEAERLLAGSGWLPDILRTRSGGYMVPVEHLPAAPEAADDMSPAPQTEDDPAGAFVELPAFLMEGLAVPQPYAVAAE